MAPVVLADTLRNLHVDAVGETDAHFAALESLLLAPLGAGEDLYVGFAVVEFDGAFGQGEYPFAVLDHHAGVGAVSGPHENPLGDAHGGFDLEHDDAVVLGRLGGHVLQFGIEFDIQGADGQPYGHAAAEFAHVGLVDFALELHVGHVGHSGDGGAVVEGVGLDDRVADLDGHVEDHAVDGGTYLRVAQILIALGDAVLDDFHVFAGIAQFLLGLGQRGAALLVLLVGDDPSFVEHLCAVVLAAGLGKGDFGH